jgi:hypothetical protein
MTSRRLLARCCALAAIAASAGAARAEPLATSDFRLFMPAFSGEQPLGLNVATVVNLRIWRTFRRSPWPNPRKIDFGGGTVFWGADPIGEPAIPRADMAIEYGNYDMVLIGSAERYGDGVIAQTSLDVRPLDERDAPNGALWRVAVRGRAIDLGLPRKIFEFGTMALRPEIVADFSKPSAITLCPTKTTGCVGKELGSKFVAIQHDDDWTLVVASSRDKGWVHLKPLGREPNETVEFTGGLISYFRGDMVQAEKLFGKAAGTAAADSIVREDAKILQAAARSRQGSPASAQIDAILADDPYSRYALQVAVMDELHAYSRSGTLTDRLRRLAASVRQSRELFESDDPWLPSAEAIFAALGI